MTKTPADDEAEPGTGTDLDSQLLDEKEQAQAVKHSSPKARVIHEIVREEGEAELKRPPAALFWSGLAAGLSMGFSLLTLALLEGSLPDTSWRRTISSVGYSLGFVIAVLGKQQLFTETTLTATIPFLMRRDRETFIALMRMWGIVLVSNLIGTFIFAWLISRPGLFDLNIQASLISNGKEIVEGATLATVFKAMLAGWLIALMVWILPGASSARLFVIILLTYVVSLGHFPHIVAGSADAAYVLFTGNAGVGDYIFGFLLPTLFGNTVGGVALAAILNHAPIAHEIASENSGG